MCGLFQYLELNLKYIIFLRGGFISNYEYAQGSLKLTICLFTSLAKDVNKQIVNFVFKNYVGCNYNRYLGWKSQARETWTTKQWQGCILKYSKVQRWIFFGFFFGFTLENTSIFQTWTGERVAPGHCIFPRCKKMDFNSQHLTLELSMKLSRSFQASYTIKSHGSVVDLKHVLKNSGGTTTGQTYPSALDLFWKRAKQLLPYSQTQQASFRTLKIVPRSHKRECFLTFV